MDELNRNHMNDFQVVEDLLTLKFTLKDTDSVNVNTIAEPAG